MKPNDTVGVGLDLRRGEIFFTYEGNSMGVAFTGIDTSREFFPSATLNRKNQAITFNFGPHFKCDLTKYLKSRPPVKRKVPEVPVEKEKRGVLASIASFFTPKSSPTAATTPTITHVTFDEAHSQSSESSASAAAVAPSLSPQPESASAETAATPLPACISQPCLVVSPLSYLSFKNPLIPPKTKLNVYTLLLDVLLCRLPSTYTSLLQTSSEPQSSISPFLLKSDGAIGVNAVYSDKDSYPRVQAMKWHRYLDFTKIKNL